MTNSVQEIVAVGSLEGRDVPRRAIAERLLEAYREVVAREAGRGLDG